MHGTADFTSTDDFIPNIYFNAVKEGMKSMLRRIAQKRIEPLSYTYYYHPYFKELDHFFESVKNNAELKISPDEALKTLKVIEEGYRRTESGKS